MRLPRALLFLLLLAPAAPSLAARFVEREVECPVCSNGFYARLDVPDPDYEMRLDLKPIAPVEGPWRLPDCPKCGFVLYAARLGPAERAAAAKIAVSKEYLAALTRSTYYRAGLLFARQGKPPFLLASTFLKASWQEEASPALLKEDLELALKYFTDCAAACRGAEQENSRLLAGEVLRRLGRFPEAGAHFKALRGSEGFKDNFFADVIEFELALIGSRDGGPREMAEVKAAKLPFYSRWWWYLRRSWTRFMASFEKKEEIESIEAGLPAAAGD